MQHFAAPSAISITLARDATQPGKRAVDKRRMTIDVPRTCTDLTAPASWWLDDRVDALRVIATEHAFALPPTAATPWLVGAADDCAIRIAEPHVSRRHARLEPDGDRWSLRDLASKNGVWLDGSRRPGFVLTPGSAIGIGGITLIAESERLRALHRLLQRWLGFARERALDVDRALLALRDAAMFRAALVLRGRGDMRPIAKRLHDAIFGADRPFVAYEHAHADAIGGSLFVTASAPALALRELAIAQRLPESRVCLVIGSSRDEDAAALARWFARIAVIELPNLASRRDEIARILADEIEDAVRTATAHARVARRDRAALCDHGFDSLADIIDAARRVVALRGHGVTRGAAALGITHAALSRWATRRGVRV